MYYIRSNFSTPAYENIRKKKFTLYYIIMGEPSAKLYPFLTTGRFAEIQSLQKGLLSSPFTANLTLFKGFTDYQSFFTLDGLVAGDNSL